MFNLPKSAQEVVNLVCEGLASQNWQQSIEYDSTCAYRGSNGHRCAAGWLIPDEAYDPAMEGEVWCDVENDHVPTDCRHTDLIADLQRAHDSSCCGNMPKKIFIVILDYGLECPDILKPKVEQYLCLMDR